MEQSRETKLAYEIASILDDLKSIDWHIANAKHYSETFLRETLAYVLSKPGVRNRAGYYNKLIQLHGKHPRS